MMVKEGGLRRDASSAKQGRDQKVQFALQGDVLGVSIDKDTRHGSMGAMKYVKESCYHRIKCSVANSLAALMRK